MEFDIEVELIQRRVLHTEITEKGITPRAVVNGLENGEYHYERFGRCGPVLDASHRQIALVHEEEDTADAAYLRGYRIASL